MNDIIESFKVDELVKLTDLLREDLKKAKAEIERLSLDVKILSDELEFERRPKRDER
jgi:hypothetical protein